MKRLAAILSLLALLSGTSAQVPAPAKPNSPQEELKTFKLAKGLRIELVACEPQIESPVFMAFDPKGRIWVVEMRDYPNGPAPGQPAEGRIRILEDKDQDGFFETSSIFADKLLFANGLIHWKDGVIVTAAPHIAFLRDTDGDGKVDTKEILYEGFAAQNPQLRVSHPILGLDGWIYVANGLRGGKVIPANRPDAKPIDLSGMDFRFDMLTGQHEAISGLGQFGNTFDDWGNRFVCDNRHHLRHIVIENRYLKRNPYLAAPGVVEDISVLDDGPLSSGGKIYPLSKNWTTSNLHEGRFTAACGVHIYRGDLLPEPYRGAAFTCDPTGNLVHGEVMEPKGATFTSHPFEKGVEFLASPDDWFRPVSLAGGPDGALYVVDMYRAVIEHPEFMPPELRKRPDLTLGKEKGRIWRIVPENHKFTPTKPLPTTTAELVQLLNGKNAWERVTAERLLLERQDPKAATMLQVLTKTASPVGVIQAAWLLERMGKLSEERIAGLLKSDDPHVVEQALRLAEPRLAKSEGLRKAILELAQKSKGRLAFQLSLSLGELGGGDDVLDTLAELLLVGKDDLWTRQAVYSSVPGRAGQLLQYVNPRSGKAIHELASLVGAREDPLEIKLVFKRIMNPHWEEQILPGLLEGVSRRGTNFEALLAKHPDKSLLKQWKGQLADIKTMIQKKDAGATEVTASLPILAHAAWDKSLEKTLGDLLSNDKLQGQRLAIIRVIAAHNDPEVPKLLLRDWRTYTPAVRKEVTEAMMRNPQRIAYLLRQVEEGNLRPGDIDVLRTRQLLNHPQAAIREKAQKLLRDNIPADRKEVLAAYQKSLKLKGDPKAGQAIFKKNCATCHRIAGVGIDVAPDISDTRTKTFEALLTDILNPNAAIDNNYVNYLVTTKSGKTVTGILASETATSITLKRAEGESDVILRQEVDEISSTGVSLMPDGLEKNISVAEMADLLSFLKNWRYLDGSVPLANP